MESQPPNRTGQIAGVVLLLIVAAAALTSLSDGRVAAPSPPPPAKSTVNPVVAAPVRAPPPNQARAQAEAVMRAHCKSEWPEDFEMQAYCLHKQREAYHDLHGE